MWYLECSVTVSGIVEHITGCQRRRCSGETGDASQAGANIERPFSDISDGVGDAHARQSSTKVECIFADVSDGVGYGDTCQARAIMPIEMTELGITVFIQPAISVLFDV